MVGILYEYVRLGAVTGYIGDSEYAGSDDLACGMEGDIVVDIRLLAYALDDVELEVERGEAVLRRSIVVSDTPGYRELLEVRFALTVEE